MDDPFDTYDVDVELEERYPQDDDPELEEERDDAEQLAGDFVSEEADQVEFGASYREKQQATAGQRPQGDTFAPLGGRLARANRSPEDVARDQINQTLNTAELSYLSESDRQSIHDRLDELPYLPLYNIDTLVKAAAYLERNNTLNKKDFQAFAKRINSTGINQIDIVRYIRFLLKTPSS